jgi:ketosteroid isomerase-like protein
MRASRNRFRFFYLAGSAVLALLITASGCGSEAVDISRLESELMAAEADFARTMADRDLETFSSFLAEEAVFFSGDKVMRGRQAVTNGWARYFEGSDPPFSWAPEAAAVLKSGRLGFSSGPVYSPDGRRIGTFNSIWRRTGNNRWEIVFDRGCPPCRE